MQTRGSSYPRGGTSPAHSRASADAGAPDVLPAGETVAEVTGAAGDFPTSGHIEAVAPSPSGPVPSPALPTALPDASGSNLPATLPVEPSRARRARTSLRSLPRRIRPRVGRPRFRPLRAPVRLHTFESFKYRNYLFLWISTTFSGAGYWLQQIVVGWLTYEVTGSAFWTTLALGLDVLPVLLAGPLGGVITDRFDRRKLLAIIYGYQAVLTALFATLALAGNLAAWHIFAYIFLMGTAMVVTDPARMSMIPNIVPKDTLVNAFALNSMGFSIARLVAPALGGLLIVLAGPGAALVVQALLSVFAMIAALFLHVPSSKRPALRLRAVFSDLGEGVRYVLGDPLLVGLFAITAIPSTLVMPSIQGLLPVYAAEVFQVDAEGLGLLMAGVGAGSTVGTLVIASKGNIQSKNLVVLASMFVLTLATGAFSLNVFMPAVYVNLMVISAAMMALYSVSSSIVYARVPDEFRGRVSGLFVLTWGMMPIGSLSIGFLAEHLGAPGATQVAAGAILLLFGLGFWRIRALRQLSPA